MPRYLIERTFPTGLSIPMTAEGARACRGVVDNNASEGVTWVLSYVRVRRQGHVLRIRRAKSRRDPPRRGAEQAARGPHHRGAGPRSLLLSADMRNIMRLFTHNRRARRHARAPLAGDNTTAPIDDELDLARLGDRSLRDRGRRDRRRLCGHQRRDAQHGPALHEAVVGGRSLRGGQAGDSRLRVRGRTRCDSSPWSTRFRSTSPRRHRRGSPAAMTYGTATPASSSGCSTRGCIATIRRACSSRRIPACSSGEQLAGAASRPHVDRARSPFGLDVQVSHRREKMKKVLACCAVLFAVSTVAAQTPRKPAPLDAAADEDRRPTASAVAVAASSTRHVEGRMERQSVELLGREESDPDAEHDLVRGDDVDGRSRRDQGRQDDDHHSDGWTRAERSVARVGQAQLRAHGQLRSDRAEARQRALRADREVRARRPHRSAVEPHGEPEHDQHARRDVPHDADRHRAQPEACTASSRSS